MDGGRWTGLWRPRQNMRFCVIQNALANSFADFCRVPVHNHLKQSWGASHCVFQKVQRAVLCEVTDGLALWWKWLGFAVMCRQLLSLGGLLHYHHHYHVVDGHRRVSTSQSENQRSALRISCAISPYLHVLGGTTGLSLPASPSLLSSLAATLGSSLGAWNKVV